MTRATPTIGILLFLLQTSLIMAQSGFGNDNNTKRETNNFPIQRSAKDAPWQQPSASVKSIIPAPKSLGSSTNTALPIRQIASSDRVENVAQRNLQYRFGVPTSRETGVDLPDESMPKPTAEDLAEFGKYVDKIVDPRNTFDVIVGRARVMVLKTVPKRIQVEDETIVGKPIIISPLQLSISGKRTGSTVLTLYFADPASESKEKILSYLVRVTPDPIQKELRSRTLKELANEINRTFPDSVVEINLVGERVVLSGEAKDIEEAYQIYRIVQASVTYSTGDLQRTRNDVVIPNTVPVNSFGRPENVITEVQGARVDELGIEVVNLLRVPGEQQVMLQVTVAEVNRAAARSIGINFSIEGSTGSGFRQGTGNVLSSFAQQGFGQAVGGAANLLASIDNGQIRLAINALRNVNLARSLAEPNLTAINGRTANFQAGGQFPVPVVTGATAIGLQGVQFVPFGVSLQFTPTITDKDRIRLQLAAEVSTRDTATGSGSQINGAAVPSLTTRNFSSTVELRDGETIAVAGLIQNNFGGDTDRVPLFGDIPVIGRFFAFDRTSCADQELVVLVTPRLVHPLRGQLPALPGSDMLAPDDAEFYLHGRLQSQRACVAGRTPAQHMQNVERSCLIGPVGHSDGITVSSVPTSNSTGR